MSTHHHYVRSTLRVLKLYHSFIHTDKLKNVYIKIYYKNKQTVCRHIPTNMQRQCDSVTKHKFCNSIKSWPLKIN